MPMFHGRNKSDGRKRSHVLDKAFDDISPLQRYVRFVVDAPAIALQADIPQDRNREGCPPASAIQHFDTHVLSSLWGVRIRHARQVVLWLVGYIDGMVPSSHGKACRTNEQRRGV